MMLDLTTCSPIRPSISFLHRHFELLKEHHPAPIRHPESMAFQARFQNTHASAAVLIPIICSDEDNPEVILTRRAKHLRHHPGQISFPGGSREPHDPSASATALRETHEEIGVSPEQVQVLGQLGDYYTVSGYRVSPIVGLLTQQPELILDPNEVCETLTVPLDFLMDPGNFSLCDVVHEGEKRQYYSAHYQEQHIWGVTAGIIIALYETLRKPMTI